MTEYARRNLLVLLLSSHKYSFCYLSASIGSPWSHNSFLEDNDFDHKTSVRHHNYTCKKQSAAGIMGKGRPMGQCDTAMFDNQHCIRELWKWKNTFAPWMKAQGMFLDTISCCTGSKFMVQMCHPPECCYVGQRAFGAFARKQSAKSRCPVPSVVTACVQTQHVTDGIQGAVQGTAHSEDSSELLVKGRRLLPFASVQQSCSFSVQIIYWDYNGIICQKDALLPLPASRRFAIPPIRRVEGPVLGVQPVTKQYTLPLKIQNKTSKLYSTFTKMKSQNFVVLLARRNLVSQQKRVLLIEEFSFLTEENSSSVLLSFNLVLRARLSVPSCLQAQLKSPNRVKSSEGLFAATGPGSKQQHLFEIFAAALMAGHDRFPVSGDEITLLVVAPKPLNLSCAWKHPMDRVTVQTNNPFLLRSPVSRGNSELCWGVIVLGLCLGVSATRTHGINENEKLLTQTPLMTDILMTATTAPCSAGQQGREQRQVIQRGSIHEKQRRMLDALTLNLAVQDLLISPVPPCWQLKCLFCSSELAWSKGCHICFFLLFYVVQSTSFKQTSNRRGARKKKKGNGNLGAEKEPWSCKLPPQRVDGVCYGPAPPAHLCSVQKPGCGVGIKRKAAVPFCPHQPEIHRKIRCTDLETRKTLPDLVTYMQSFHPVIQMPPRLICSFILCLKVKLHPRVC
ncbi:hypothetical protein IHE44_0004975 [Lamprotornis superbus]|uniref:Uncharacterized protein n=1 Tax=Lamprotornis superbus TaxID=245042 RepID=A0A835TW28_9PASS|nr:hypothetical protein IHE44_0004975 [Lamprotornis superbus]